MRSRARFLAVLASVSMLGACAGGEPPSPRRDGGTDSGRTDAASTPDAGGDDASTGEDAAADDAATEDDAAIEIDAHVDPDVDAGPRTAPVVDGVLGGAEWAGVTVSTNDVATAWTGNELTSVRGVVVDGTLYVAIEGRVEGGNAIVAYFDGDPGGARGVGDLSTLTDSAGALDNAISAGFVTPAANRFDVAWGTLDLSRTAAGPDDRMGFRDLVPSASDFAWLTSPSVVTACAVSTCEMSVPVDALGPAASGIELFVRIVNHDGTMSPNQALPIDDATMPRTVSTTYEVIE